MFGSKGKEEKKQAKKAGFFAALFGTSGKPSSSSAKKKISGSHRDSYGDGYDDVYFEEKYDKDRYNRDQDYRNGVEDATLDLFEEEEEDW